MSSVSLQAKAARLTLPRWLPLLLVFVVAVLLRGVLAANPDVSWGLTMAEKWFDGGRLYVDIIEVNPPATLYLYIVPVVLERLTGLSAEIFVNILVLSVAALSLWLAARVLLAAGLIGPEQGWTLAAWTAALMTILPARAFAEREHIALIAMLPLLAVAWLRAERKVPHLLAAVLAGIGGGTTAIIKPYFAAAIVLSSVATAWSARSWRVLFALENCIAAAMLAAYLAFVWLAYPVYVSDMLPLLAAVYIPVKEPLAVFLLHAALPLWTLLVLVIWWLARRAALRPPISLALAASAGFGAAYFVQQKGWSNHAYPMLALALLAFGYALLARPGERAAQRIGGIAGLAVAGITFYWMGIVDDRTPLAAAIRAISPHARVLAISPDLMVGHPAVRSAGGIWVSRVSALWITQGVLMARARDRAHDRAHDRADGGLDPAAAARLDAYANRDRTMLSEDIGRNRPDVILAEREPGYDWLAWARSDPLLARDLEPYRLDRTIGDIVVLRRTGP
jgi:hypothetical protein